MEASMILRFFSWDLLKEADSLLMMNQRQFTQAKHKWSGEILSDRSIERGGKALIAEITVQNWEEGGIGLSLEWNGREGEYSLLIQAHKGFVSSTEALSVVEKIRRIINSNTAILHV